MKTVTVAVWAWIVWTLGHHYVCVACRQEKSSSRASARRKWECTNRSSAQQVSLVNFLNVPGSFYLRGGQSLPTELWLASALQDSESWRALLF